MQHKRGRADAPTLRMAITCIPIPRVAGSLLPSDILCRHASRDSFVAALASHIEELQLDHRLGRIRYTFDDEAARSMLQVPPRSVLGFRVSDSWLRMCQQGSDMRPKARVA